MSVGPLRLGHGRIPAALAPVVGGLLLAILVPAHAGAEPPASAAPDSIRVQAGPADSTRARPEARDSVRVGAGGPDSVRVRDPAADSTRARIAAPDSTLLPAADTTRARIAAPDSARAPAADSVRVRAPEPPRGRFPAPDSARVRLEIGASSDLTNEQFYEDAFTSADSIFHPRQLVSSPESRLAAVLFGSVVGTRAGRAVIYQLQNELSLGDKVQREVFGLSWRHDLSPVWRLHLLPRADYRRDRSFDRDLTESRGSVDARLRRGLLEGATLVELGASGELVRTAGQGASFLLDRNAGKGSLVLEHAPLFGAEWRLGYSQARRSFPDSSERNHLEHGWEGRWRRDFTAGHSVLLETGGWRRSTLRPARTSRDNFWRAEGLCETELRRGGPVSLRGSFAGEGLRYDHPDSVLFFDYQIARARLTPRLERESWALGAGPRAEALWSPANPTEEYREIGGVLEFEYAEGGRWWSLTPAAGWRDYAGASRAGSLDAIDMHSSYAFYEVTVMGDQALHGALRLRLLATARLESHIDSAQDARSLYFSLDLRKLF